MFSFHLYQADCIGVFCKTEMQEGKCLLQNNNSQIPERELRIMIKIIEARSADVIQKWSDTFGKTDFYC